MRRLTIRFLSLTLLISASLLAPAGALEAAPAARSARVAQQSAGPMAQFTVDFASQSDPSQNARVHDTVNFDATPSQGSNLSYSWNFGDGSQPASGRQVSHSFGLIDDYSVALSVTDAAGQTSSTSQTVRIIPLIDSLVGQPPFNQVMVAGAVPVVLNIQAPGPNTIAASLTGDLLNSKAVPFSTRDDLEYVTLNAVVADERNAEISQAIIQKPGGSIPLQGNLNLRLAYQTQAGKDVELSFSGTLLKDRDPSKGFWSITYPDFSATAGPTDPSEGEVEGFYLKGDPGFHHPDDPLVRRYTIAAARAGGVLPSDPAQVMENIYTYVGGLFDSDDPAEIDSDSVIAQKIASGELVPGDRKVKYICISQTYFLASLSRTMGLPTRELTIALANPASQNPNSGVWTVKYVQEGAAQIWFDGGWHLYDTWLRIRKLNDYLIKKLALQAWYAYSPQSFELRAKNGDPLNLKGHNFAIGEEEGTPADPSQWYLLSAQARDGITVAGFPAPVGIGAP